MTPLAPHITSFLRERLPREKGASVHTCDTYAYGFKLLFAFASSRLGLSPSQLMLEHLDAALILAFLEHIETRRGNAAATRNVRLAAVRSFMKFVEYRVPSTLEQVRRVLAIPMKRTDTRLVIHLSRSEMQAVLNAPDPSTRDGTRDRAMLHVACAAGLRVSELVGLRLDGLSFDPRLSVRVLGKGRRERVLPLWKETATALRAWLVVRGSSPVPQVFLNAVGLPLTRSGFEYILERHVRSAAQRCESLRDKRVSPHVLRHTCAMLALQATGDLRKVALWLGHASTQTTEMYVRADPSTQLDTMKAGTPPSLRKGRFTPPDALITAITPRGPTRRYAERPPVDSSRLLTNPPITPHNGGHR
jgi:site-specific recombinase XerD